MVSVLSPLPREMVEFATVPVTFSLSLPAPTVTLEKSSNPMVLVLGRFAVDTMDE